MYLKLKAIWMSKSRILLMIPEKQKAGSLFVCIEGFKVDGHKFIPQAIENGTRAFLVQKDVDVPDDATVVRVKDTRYALASVADIFFRASVKQV